MRVQHGETELIPELWQRVERFVRWQAVQYFGRLSAPHCELEDLIQSGYEALIYAVQMHDPEKGSFLTYFGHALHRVFCEAAGYRHVRDAFLRCKQSLDEPVSSDEDDDRILADLVNDPRAAAAFDAAERRIFNEQLHGALETALNQIDAQDAGVIRGLYYDSKGMTQLAEEMSITPERVRQRRNKGMRTLRHNRAALRQFLDDATPSRMGGLRPTEAAVLYREDLALSKGKWV